MCLAENTVEGMKAPTTASPLNQKEIVPFLLQVALQSLLYSYAMSHSVGQQGVKIRLAVLPWMIIANTKLGSTYTRSNVFEPLKWTRGCYRAATSCRLREMPERQGAA